MSKLHNALMENNGKQTKCIILYFPEATAGWYFFLAHIYKVATVETCNQFNTGASPALLTPGL